MTDIEAIFKELIHQLSSCKVKYCVLRGYENLPESFSNDIDFGIHPKNKEQFWDVLNNIHSEGNIYIKLVETRYEVLKTKFVSNDTEVLIDFWFDFNYMGLKYANIDAAVETATFYNNFLVVNYRYEVEVSFLKELLHMNRIRPDKVQILQKKISNVKKIIFNEYYNKKYRCKFIEVIDNNSYELRTLSISTIIYLVISNIKIHGLVFTFRSVFKSILYKYNRTLNPINKNFNNICIKY